MSFPISLRNAREAAHLSLSQAAALLGISSSLLDSWEEAQRLPPVDQQQPILERLALASKRNGSAAASDHSLSPAPAAPLPKTIVTNTPAAHAKAVAWCGSMRIEPPPPLPADPRDIIQRYLSHDPSVPMTQYRHALQWLEIFS